MKYLCFDSAINGVYTLLQLQKMYPSHISLFQGKEDNRLWDVAPWIFEIDEVDIYNRWNGEHDHLLISLKRCLIFETPVKLNSFNEHLQQFLYKKIDGAIHYNRFWDAKVLKQQFEKFDTKQLLDFFEEIENVYMQDENGKQFQKYFLDKKARIVTEPVQYQNVFLKDNLNNTDKINEIKPQEIIPAEEIKKEEKPRRRFFTD